MPETVVVLGASPNRERYSNQAVRRLIEHGHRVLPVHPTADVIEGLPVLPDLSEVKEPVDTVSVYVNPSLGLAAAPAIRALRPRRVVLNPGAESSELAEQLAAGGIEVVTACTLVMLSTRSF